MRRARTIGGRKAGSAVTRPPRAVDVAALAGVSTATVSRAFNLPEKVAPEIREKVLRAAEALSWMPHAAGSALASRRTHLAGVVIPTLDNEIFASQVGGLQDVLSQHGVTLLIGCSNYDPDQTLSQVRAMLARGLEALALVGEAHRPELFDMIAMRGIPYALMYSYRENSPHPSVGFDNAKAFGDITRHLLDLGHREFGAIFQPRRDNDRVEARIAGMATELAERGLALRPQHMKEGPWSIAFGRTSLRAMMSGPEPRPTAVICGNDYLAIGALIEARAMGLDVPRDLSVTGFDDVAMAEQTEPPLTTVRVNNAEIGRRAAAFLLSPFGERAAVPPKQLESRLVLRGSTGPSPSLFPSETAS